MVEEEKGARLRTPRLMRLKIACSRSPRRDLATPLHGRAGSFLAGKELETSGMSVDLLQRLVDVHVVPVLPPVLLTHGSPSQPSVDVRGLREGLEALARGAPPGSISTLNMLGRQRK